MLNSFVYKMYEDDDFDDETGYPDDFEEEDGEEMGRYYNGYDDDDYQNPDNDYEED
ncbi:hypothetical protein [Helicobacter anatolicus]|uniref:hypothetical protein n=1 Tax=Helicobacter anatolicus TaxID=2905874 RepID=UPI001E3EE0B0|nr:hypothetical protein [Helicobacter anatolicus]MCE3039245.1 hypothetical protein [Helicobacter anatolicus]